jgi:hypothetical protein
VTGAEWPAWTAGHRRRDEGPTDFPASGSNGSPGAVMEVGTYTPGAFAGGDASASGLDAHIEENHVSVSFVTLSCADRCAGVVAVATGGQPPYAYAWEDGSTGASRVAR